MSLPSLEKLFLISVILW